MKKFLLMLGAAMMGLTASAQLYVTGGDVVGAPAAWDPKNPLEVTLQNGAYTFKATGNFKMSTAKGGWDEAFNPAALSLDGAWNRDVSTATGKLKKENGDMLAPKADVEITYVVNEAMTDITATLPEGEVFGEIVMPDFYLVGEMNDWNPSDANYKMTRSGNEYTYVAENGISGKWKICNGTWAQTYGQGESAMPVVGTEYNLAFNGGNLNTDITEKVTIKFTYTEGGPYKLLITKYVEEPPVPTVPEKLYLIGNIENCQYGADPHIGVEMTKEGNVFKCESVMLDAYEGNAWFSFCQALAEESIENVEEAWGVVNSYDRFGPQSETVVTPGQATDFTTFVAGVNASACGSYKIAANTEGQKYVFTMDFVTNKLSVSTASSVDTIDAELQGTPVYFNLQGQRVDNPENGIYVRVLNGKATKVMK